MAEDLHRPFIIVPSESVRNAYVETGDIETDLDALRGQAALLRAPLPPDPRILLLNPGEIAPVQGGDALPLHADTSHLLGRWWVPPIETANDIVVHLPNTNAYGTEALNVGLTRALIAARRERQRRKGGRIGAGLVAAGVALGGASAVEHRGWGQGAGAALFLAGSGLIAVVHNRGRIITPPVDIDQGKPLPMRFVPHDDSH